VKGTTKLNRAVAVVTGASSGIGEATARAFSARGSKAILVARNKSRLDCIVAEIRSRGGNAVAYPADLANPREVSITASRIVSDQGVPDILVNKAGTGRWLPIDETTAEEAAQMAVLPYLTALNVTREFLITVTWRPWRMHPWPRHGLETTPRRYRTRGPCHARFIGKYA
jgi:uncharacterized protein